MFRSSKAYCLMDADTVSVVIASTVRLGLIVHQDLSDPTCKLYFNMTMRGS